MSNYDWYDDWTPYDKDVKRAEGGARHCGSTKEHKGHHFSVTPYDPNYRRVRPGPYYICPGTAPRTERFKDLAIHFHDDGSVTWSAPDDVNAAVLSVTQNRKLAADVEPL